MLVKPFIAVLVLYSEVVVLVLGEHHILGGHGHAWALLWLEHAPSVGHAIGPRQWVHLTNVKYILSVHNVINKLPDYQSFGRKTKLRLNPDRIPDLHWNLSTTLNTTPTLTTQQSLIQTSIVSV